ncbi:unnamed protein product [Merluccius merluccius]
MQQQVLLQESVSLPFLSSGGRRCPPLGGGGGAASQRTVRLDIQHCRSIVLIIGTVLKQEPRGRRENLAWSPVPRCDPVDWTA